MGKKKSEAEPRVTKYFKDGIVDYHSFSCHHRKEEVRGNLFKMAKEVKFFSFGLYYKRYFILSAAEECLFI